MVLKEVVITIIILLTTIQTLIHAVEGCDICITRNGTDIKLGIKPALSDVKEQTHMFIPLTTLGSITAVLTVVLVKSRRKR